MERRLEYINGIKGIACIMVVASHFYETFGYVFWGLDFFIEKTDLIFSGPWAVRFFFILSAFLVSNSLSKNISVDKIKIAVVKRYLRLALPLLPICFFIWCLQRLGCFYNDEVSILVQNEEIGLYFNHRLRFLDIFESAIYKIIFLGDISFNSNFWMLRPLFIGNLLSLVLCVLTYDRKRSKTIFAIIIMIFLAINDNHFPFIVGTALSYWWTNRKSEIVVNRKYGELLWTAVFLAGFIIGEFKGYILLVIEKIGTFDIDLLQFLLNSNFYNSISILLMLLSILQLTYMQRILQHKIFVTIGKMSYYIFLLHWPIICTVSAGLFVWIIPNVAIASAARIIFIPTIIIVIFASYISVKYIDKICNKITKNIVNNI